MSNSKLLILTLLFLPLLVGCIDDVGTNNSYFEYSVDIVPSNKDHYKLIIPIAFNHFINSDEMKEAVIDNLEIVEGAGNFSYRETKYGLGLEIFGSGNIKLKSEKTGGEYYGFVLSMDTNISNRDNDRTHWIFLESTNNMSIEISVDVQNEADSLGGGRLEYTEPEYQIITNGWNVITTIEYVWNY